ncbi:hypothetical protein L873DRAFT_1786343 [Choiromyces venosus 120613-1]|uniref:WSC domain-containing protein n=1 Tax=Choiromyces venosus 120613-1 TaxID=1336337 RepID=A0A3N4K0A6_9PEZI|nr:hypothetical protein L873DRAFT_1786343 [Choiromyces venosus 120613-1]
MSHGLCFDNCKATYAFAIVQGSRCWCSDYAPASTTTGCDQGCPGYGIESCGNTKKDLFGYIALPNTPKGTAGGSSTVRESDSPTPSTPLNFSPSHSPSISTVIEEKPGPTTTVIITASPTSTSSSSTTSSSTSTSTTSTSTQATTSPPVSIVTSVGGYRTVTLAPTEQTPAPTHQASSSNSSNGNFFSKPGRVAGLFVGLALGIILVVAALLFFCYRRNKQRASLNSVDPPGSATVTAVAGAGVFGGRRRSRSMSTLGLIGEKGGTAVDTTPASTANNFSGLPAAEAGKSTTAAQTPGRLIDQRLDPNQIYLRYDPDTGSSRMSVRSLRDDTDYSRRVLRLANPDD